MPFFFITLGLMFILIAPVIGAFFGGLAGWVVGLFFGDTILPIVHLVVPDVTMWQVGVFLGFVGSFFKSSLTIKS